jgi:hypothetical protein
MRAQLGEAGMLERHVVVVVEVVDANHGHALLKQSLGAMHADKAGTAGDQNRIHGAIQRYWYCAGVALAGIFSKGCSVSAARFCLGGEDAVPPARDGLVGACDQQQAACGIGAGLRQALPQLCAIEQPRA